MTSMGRGAEGRKGGRGSKLERAENKNVLAAREILRQNAREAYGRAVGEALTMGYQNSPRFFPSSHVE